MITKKIKDLIRPYYVIISNYKHKKVEKFSLVFNYIKDYQLYKKYSILFQKISFKNKEADLILNYHSIEKGMLFSQMKKGFAAQRILNLHKILNDREIIAHSNFSQIKVGYQVMCKYYELHEQAGYDLTNLFSEVQYEFYKKILNNNYNEDFNGVVSWTKAEFYENNKNDFEKFAKSRKSTREYTGNKIPPHLIRKAVELANCAPSVCNRQASNVYLVEDKHKIDKILKIQGGFTGYTKNVNQLLIVTNDRKYYYTVGERNQLYIDGGIYLLNLLYALHYHQIGNCPANWGKTHQEEQQIAKVISIPESEKIICLIPIGEVNNVFKTTLSERRHTAENFIIFE